MAGILKNQLVKRLACFTKGLSVDKIDLDILSGRGYLDNLELDENFMSSVLELPEWMCLTKIICSKIRLKVSFTKLKSEPIRIFIDTVYVEAELSKTNEKHDINVQQKLQDAGLTANGPTSYGYIEQVIDGMYISVSTIMLTFSLHHQYLKTELNEVELVSTNRKWKPDDLRKTRGFVMPNKEEVLVYKMLTVNHAKFEFFDKGETKRNAVPLKFNFNMIQLQITMKKHTATNEVVSACLKLILDDILLVFTPSQLQILLAFSKELSEVIELSAPPQNETPMVINKPSPTRSSTPNKSFLHRFSRQNEEEDVADYIIEVVSDNVLETSYHLKTGSIDMLLCDDGDSKNSGSLQLRFEVLQVDLYPHRTGNASRKHWNLPYQYVRDAHNHATEMLNEFYEGSEAPVKPLSNVYEMVVVLRCEHFQLLPVMGTKKRNILGPLLFSDKTKFGLSETEPAMVVTIATYYTDSSETSVPPQNVFLHLNPTEVNFDNDTIWWCKEFTASTMTEDFRSMLTELGKDEDPPLYKLKMSLVLPHITIPLSEEQPGTEEGDGSCGEDIRGIQLWFSKLIITNIHNGTYLPLLSLLNECLTSPLISSDDVTDSPGDVTFPNHCSDEPCFPTFKNKDVIPQVLDELTRYYRMKEDLLEERNKQKRNVFVSSPTSPPDNHVTSSPNHVTSSVQTPESPETPSTPQSRRSSISSIHISELPSCPLNPFSSLPDVFPFFENLILGFKIESFSADFIYNTDIKSAEKHRSRRFISDTPLTMWLVERTDDVTKPDDDVTDHLNGHKILTRNSLKRQNTITEPTVQNNTDYLLLLKSSKTINCLVDREQYIFLLKLQQELQSIAEKIILSVSQIFTSNTQESSKFKMICLADHVVCDVTLPSSYPDTRSLMTSPPDTASTSLSHLSPQNSPALSNHRRSVVSELSDILLLENHGKQEDNQGKTLNWVAFSRSDSNIASLSERLSLQSEDDISSIASDLSPLAKGESKETLLKFIMRVNKKREMKTTASQTEKVSEAHIVADNYQELHTVRERLNGVVTSPARATDGPMTSQLQVHCGEVAVVLLSSTEVITKIAARKILVLDGEFETKSRCFPNSKWKRHELEGRSQFSDVEQLMVRMVMFDDVTKSTNDVINTKLACDLVSRNLSLSLKDKTLEGLGLFLEPDPHLQTTPLTLTCRAEECHVQVHVGRAAHNIHVHGIDIKVNEDETIEICESAELVRLKRENEELKSRVRYLMELSNSET